MVHRKYLTNAPGYNCSPAADSVSIGDVQIVEGNSGSQMAIFSVVRSGGTAPFTVDFATADNTATVADGDYVATSGTLSFGAGVTSQTIAVTINGDTKVEPNENFFVNLLGATAGATISDSQGTGIIVNDDGAALPGSVSIGDVQIVEGNSGSQMAIFSVVRSGGTAPFTVDFATANNTATVADGDYVATSGTLSFGAGVTSQTIAVTINGDTKVEPNENFFVNLLGATAGATISDSQGTGIIVNDDGAALPGSVSIGDVQIVEGNSGSQMAIFSVVRSGGTAPFTVDFATADNTATVADGDYVATSGTLSFGAGVTSQTIAVTINGDTKVEPNENFFVNLLGATAGATISDSQGTGIIVNDDGAALPGSVSIGDVQIVEGNSGSQMAIFSVVRSGGTAPFTVDFATADNTATVADGDYVATSGTLSFGAGVTSQTIAVTINGDTKVEPNENFFVNLLGATAGATISDSQGTGIIVNDDGAALPGSVSIGDVQIVEGNSGSQMAIFSVVRSGGTAPFTVDFATADNTATVADGDYVATSGTLSFGAGVTSQTIAVTINGDTKVEPNENFFVNLLGATAGATISDSQGTGIIVNDDGAALPGSVSIGDVQIVEGNSGSQMAIFSVVRSGGTAPFTVDFATADNTATVADGDYVATSGTLSFGAGVTSQTIAVTINGDTKVEPNENFFVNLLGATAGATISDSQGTGIIVNDDGAALPGSVSIGDVQIVEGNSGSQMAIFSVVRSGGTAPFTVDFATADNTATVADGDYVATSGTLSFGAGVTSQTIAVTINGDTKVEPNENFFVNLLGATAGATISDSQGTGIIVNDDVAPVIVSDGGGDTASIIITDKTKFVDVVHATDPNPNASITYSIVGGTNQKLFTIDPKSGALSFKSDPMDGKTYEVKVAASDGILQDVQTIDVKVANGFFEQGNPGVADTFVFKPHFGVEIVNGFDPASSSHDVIELDHSLFHGATPGESGDEALHLISSHSLQVGHDLFIFTDTHDVIDLKGTNVHSLTSHDFIIT